MAKIITSDAYELIKQDIRKWAINTAIFLAPVVLIFLVAIRDNVPLNEALYLIYLWLLNTVIDLVRKYVEKTKYSVGG